MIEMNFLLFLSVLEVIFILFVIIFVQVIFLRKYRPYYLTNTRPDHYLRKYIQRLISQTRDFAAGFEKLAESGDKSAYITRQNMTARLNWLILERDFATTTQPDIRYWEDINKRIKAMLRKWKEVEIIKEPPDIENIKLALKDHNGSNNSKIANQIIGVSQEDKEEIIALKKRVETMSGYESMYKEMDVAYQTLDNTYNDLKESLKELQLEAGEADKLRAMLKQQEAQEASLDAMMNEMEASKERLAQELEQLEEAYGALEDEAMGTKTLSQSSNPDAQEIVTILNAQEKLLDGLKSSIENLDIDSEIKEKLNKYTDKIENSNREVNHSMQMLELERERLSDEIAQLQEEENSIASGRVSSISQAED